MTEEEQTRRRLQSALSQQLKPALSNFVSREMQARLGSDWLRRASRPGRDSSADSLDSYAPLKTMIDHWQAVFGEAFGALVRHKARTFVSIALDARNALAHEEKLRDADGLRYLDAMHELARLIAAPGENIAALGRLYEEQRSGQGSSSAVPSIAAVARERSSPAHASSERIGFRDSLGSDLGKVSGGPLTPGSINSYCSYANQIENQLGISLGEADLSPAGLASIIHRLRAGQKATGHSDKDITNSSAGLRAYARYRAAEAGS